VAEHGKDNVVPVGERIGLDNHPVADHPLDREAAAIDEGRDALDYGATAPVPDDGADVGQRSAADRVLLGVVAEIAAVAGPRTNVGWMLRNRRRVARSVSNLGGPCWRGELLPVARHVSMRWQQRAPDPARSGALVPSAPRTDVSIAVGETAVRIVGG
jgi:hypothetical protein